MAEGAVVGWDIGGAHVKACLLERGEVVDVAQWACPLWLGIDRLTAVLQAARARWPEADGAQHAVTMTGEMVDLFTDREDGVRRIAAELTQTLVGANDDGTSGAIHFYAGDAGWCTADALGKQWEAVASANWLATAQHAALRFGDGLLIDIGSTTTDLIAFANGRVLTRGRTDAERLQTGELVYHGVVRTPLCAITPRIAWRGRVTNVMNEFFATAADVYRLTGELDPAHDLHPSADNAAKDLPATRQRLARMIGRDAREASAGDWLAFAHAWRQAQVNAIGADLRRVMALHARDITADRIGTVVSAGCGDFLVREVIADAVCESAGEGRLVRYGREVARVAAHARGNREAVQAWAQVCAPAVAVATLFGEGTR
jgi:(4-(4-[2-(gamma-L-glutamylamino)ethyl]phenoxymethyl)furan-2-yl)methanamine synthase